MKARRGALSSLLLVGALATLGGVPAGAEERATATFAGGCFWCMQPPFEKLEGVVSTTVGYTGGHTKNPTYEEASAGGYGHAESAAIVYDHEKNPVRYKFYRWNCGRDAHLKELWGDEAPAAEAETMPRKGWNPMTFKKPDDATLAKSLTPMQYKVTQHEGTEPPFHNEYWDNHRPGIYVDVVSGEPVFSSLDKYESGTGWPSFTRPLEPGNIRHQQDRRLFTSRTEIRSAHADSHLGHVFD